MVFCIQELRDQVGNTVSTGLKLTGDIINAGVPLARSAIQQAPAIINGTRAVLTAVNSDENRERVSQIAGVGTRVAQVVMKLDDNFDLLIRGIFMEYRRALVPPPRDKNQEFHSCAWEFQNIGWP